MACGIPSALGIPLSLLGGLFKSDNEFYDTKMGSNIATARHALAIDEKRGAFEPTLWKAREGVDLKQVWFAGVHSDIGGGEAPDENGMHASDAPLGWMLKEANAAGLAIIHPSVKERYLRDEKYRPPRLEALVEERGWEQLAMKSNV